MEDVFLAVETGVVQDDDTSLREGHHQVGAPQPLLQLSGRLMELGDGLGARAETVAELHQAARQLQERLRCPYLMVTLSERGVIILHDPCLNGKEYVFHHLPAHQRAIADVSGAGDTVLSVAALCAALQIDAKTTATLSNLAGGLVCEEVGVVPIDKSRFLEEVKRICHE